MNFAISMNLLAPQNVKRRMNFMTSKIARRSDALFRIGTCCLGEPRLGMLEAPSDSARRIRAHHRIMQKPHPGEKPSEAFAAGAGRSGASGRKLHESLTGLLPRVGLLHNAVMGSDSPCAI